MLNYLTNYLIEQLSSCGSATLLVLDFSFYLLFAVCFFFLAHLIGSVAKLVSETQQNNSEGFKWLYLGIWVAKFGSLVVSLFFLFVLLIIQLSVI